MARLYTLGFEVGAAAVRAVLVDIRGGAIAGRASAAFAGDAPQNGLEALSRAGRGAVEQAGAGADAVVGIGVASTGQVLLACTADGTPLAGPELATDCESAARRMTEVARERGEPWLARCGGIVTSDQFFPKVFQILRSAPHVYAAAALFVEAGDWLVWQLTSGPFPACDAPKLVRSACQAGFRAHWSAANGHPPPSFFRAVDERLENVTAEKVRGTVCGPGRRAGELSAAAAQRLGLRAGVAVSAAAIDAHACVAGAGVASPSTLVLAAGGAGDRVLLNSRVRIERCPAGVTGGVQDGILPGYFGYEVCQPRAGADVKSAAFELRRIVESVRRCGVPVRRFVACGPPFTDNPQLAQVHADVLGEKIAVVEGDLTAARGAAVLGCLAAGEDVTGYAHSSQAIHAMTGRREPTVYHVDLAARREYERAYRQAPGAEGRRRDNAAGDEW